MSPGPGEPAGRPTICLSMIVRDEAHVIGETLDSVAPHIDHWVIVDTGSSDGTQEAIRSRMAARGIPGELHERPWRDFGANRTEALELCSGRADYAWVIDADDLVIGDLDLSGLVADSYLLRYGADFRYWRKQVFRDGLRWRYEGTVHEWPRCLDPATEARLEGEYHVDSRRLGARNLDPRKYERDARLLREALERDPADSRSAFYLAQSLADAGDQEGALEWYTRRAEMGGWGEEVFYSHLRRGGCLLALGRPWEQALDAYLAAWQSRPTRAESLCAIASHYRLGGEYDLGHLFAKRAAEIPFPEDDLLNVGVDVYTWRARDELAICAFYVGELAESFALSSALAEDEALPEAERARVLANRDLCVEPLAEATARYPEATVRRLTEAAARGGAEPEITLSITSCRRLPLFERTVNSFLNCCEDVDRVGRFICIDNGSSPSDRRRMRELYPFFEFVETDPERERHADSINRILDLVETPLWLQLEDDWQFFAPGVLIERALAILDDDLSIGQVAFNRNYGETLDDRTVVGGEVRRTARDRRRYRLHTGLDGERLERHLESLAPGERTNAHWPHFTLRPSLIRTEAARRVGRFEPASGHFELEFAQRWSEAGLRTAFFDQINCLHIGRLTSEPAGAGAPSAYELVGDGTHPARPVADLDPAAVGVRVINLARRDDRWSAFRESVAAAAGPGFRDRCRRLDAVDGQALELTDEIRELFRGNDFGYRRAMVGCALSHVEAWRELANSGAGAGLVLEDDARLCDRFEERLADLCRLLDREQRGFDLVLLGLHRHGSAPAELARASDELGVRSLDPAGFLGGASAYLLSAQGARRLLGLVERDGIQNGIDVFIVRKHAELRLLECDPPLAAAPLVLRREDGDSDIQYDFEPLPEPGRRPARLAALAPSALVGTLTLEIEPGRACTSASFVNGASGEDGLRIAVRTSAGPDAPPADYVVALDDELEVKAIEAAGPAEAGPRDAVFGSGRLSIAAGADGARAGHRFVLGDEDGRPTASSPPFTLLGGEAERPGGLALDGDEVVIAFTSEGSAGIAVLDAEEVRELLEPCA